LGCGTEGFRLTVRVSPAKANGFASASLLQVDVHTLAIPVPGSSAHVLVCCS